ncbi:hypothetical protein BV20DRAFT_920028, partial [Pilatotrama ljubarskyi]
VVETELRDDAVDERRLGDADGARRAITFDGDTDAEASFAEIGNGPFTTQIVLE